MQKYALVQTVQFFCNIPRLNILTKDENPLTNLPLEKSNIFLFHLLSNDIKKV